MASSSNRDHENISIPAPAPKKKRSRRRGIPVEFQTGSETDGAEAALDAYLDGLRDLLATNAACHPLDFELSKYLFQLLAAQAAVNDDPDWDLWSESKVLRNPQLQQDLGSLLDHCRALVVELESELERPAEATSPIELEDKKRIAELQARREFATVLKLRLRSATSTLESIARSGVSNGESLRSHYTAAAAFRAGMQVGAAAERLSLFPFIWQAMLSKKTRRKAAERDPDKHVAVAVHEYLADSWPKSRKSFYTEYRGGLPPNERGDSPEYETFLNRVKEAITGIVSEVVSIAGENGDIHFATYETESDQVNVEGTNECEPFLRIADDSSAYLDVAKSLNARHPKASEITAVRIKKIFDDAVHPEASSGWALQASECENPDSQSQICPIQAALFESRASFDEAVSKGYLSRLFQWMPYKS